MSASYQCLFVGERAYGIVFEGLKLLEGQLLAIIWHVIDWSPNWNVHRPLFFPNKPSIMNNCGFTYNTVGNLNLIYFPTFIRRHIIMQQFVATKVIILVFLLNNCVIQFQGFDLVVIIWFFWSIFTTTRFGITSPWLQVRVKLHFVGASENTATRVKEWRGVTNQTVYLDEFVKLLIKLKWLFGARLFWMSFHFLDSQIDFVVYIIGFSVDLIQN